MPGWSKVLVGLVRLFVTVTFVDLRFHTILGGLGDVVSRQLGEDHDVGL